MTQREHAKWLYEQTMGGNAPRWDNLDAPEHNQWVRLAALIQADRRNLAIRLLNGLNNVWDGLGRPEDGGVGAGFRDLRNVAHELDPKGPIT